MNSKKFGGAFLVGAITLSWMASAQEGQSEHAYRLLRTAPQIMEKQAQEEPVRSVDGSFTHIIYAPASSEAFFEEVDLSVREVEDFDKVNEILTKLCELYNDSADREQVVSLIIRLLAPRYEGFLRRAFPSAGYVLIHQPSVVNGTLFPIEVDTLTFAQVMRTDIADMMHTISVGYSCITEDDLEVIIVLLAHEMAHRVREHVLEEFYCLPPTQEGLNNLIRDQEREADRIALLVLRDARYAKAQIKKFAQEMDSPYIVAKATGRKQKLCTDGSTTHPPHQERIYNALVFWIELIMKRDNLSEEKATALVKEEYQKFLFELELKEETMQQLTHLLNIKPGGALPVHAETPSVEQGPAYRLLRTSSQIMEQPEHGRPFKPLDGSFTHIIYAPERAASHLVATDLTVQECGDSDNINALLSTLIEFEPMLGRGPEFLRLMVHTLAPRYAHFIRHALPEAGYVLIHQPSVTSGTLFHAQLGAFTEAQGTPTDIADMMHSISFERGFFYEEDLDSIAVLLAHEMAHRVCEHLIEEHYTMFDCEEDCASFIRDQEREADRIALLVLREERYIKACIKKFAQEIDHPYTKDDDCMINTQETDSHPSHHERISNALDFWVEMLMKRDNLAEEKAYAMVKEAYQTFLIELELQSSTVQQLSQLL